MSRLFAETVRTALDEADEPTAQQAVTERSLPPSDPMGEIGNPAPSSSSGGASPSGASPAATVARCRPWPVETSRSGRARLLPACVRRLAPPPPEIVAADRGLLEPRRRRRRPPRPGWLGRPRRSRPPAPRRHPRTSPLSRLLAESSSVRRTSATSMPRSRRSPPRPRAVRPEGLAGREVRQPVRTCGRSVVLDEVVWEALPDEARGRFTSTIAARSAATRSAEGNSVTARSTTRTWPDRRDGPARPGLAPSATGSRRLTGRTPRQQLLDLHSPRQLVGLRRSSERIEGTSVPRPWRPRCGWRSSTPSCPRPA